MQRLLIWILLCPWSIQFNVSDTFKETTPESVLDTDSGYVQDVDGDEKKINMVVLLPQKQGRLFSIQRVYPALEIAIERVRQNQMLPGYNMSLKYGDSNCSIADGMNEAIGFFARKEVDVFFGPCCDYAAAPVGRQEGHHALGLLIDPYKHNTPNFT